MSTPTVSLDDMIAAAGRELGLRRSVYPKRVRAGQMTQAQADRETAAMAAILANLKAQQPETKQEGTQGELSL